MRKEDKPEKKKVGISMNTRNTSKINVGKIEKGRRGETMNWGIWNVRGIKGKEVELVKEMKKLKLDILAVTETKKKAGGMEHIMEGYNILWTGVKYTAMAHAGVAVIVKAEYMKKIVEMKEVNERILTLILIMNKQKYHIIVVYAPNENASAEEKTRFFEEVQKEIDAAESNNIMVMGDLNGRVGNDNTGIEKWLGREGENLKNNNGKRIIDLCMENDLVIGNTKFSHKDIHKITREEINRKERSIIDYYLIHREIWKYVKDIKVKRSAEIGSDHYLVNMVYKLMQEEIKEKKRKIIKDKIKGYKLRERVTREKYHKTLGELQKKTVYQNLDERWENYKSSLKEAAKVSCGVTKIGNGFTKRTAWWTEEIEEAVKRKKKAWKTYLSSKSQDNYDKYKTERIKVKNQIKTGKEKSWTEFGKKLTESYNENQKLFYNTLKQMRKPKTNMLQNLKDRSGNIITEEASIMERWREYFKDLLEENEIEENIEEEEREDTRNGEQEENQAQEEEITGEEFRQAMVKMKLGKAPGHDELTAEMIKYANMERKEELLNIFNQAWKERKVPLDWQIGIIAPIYKKGDSKECSNYRGITLGSTVGKLYGRILEGRLRKKVEHTLEESQSGFRKERGTTDQIFIVRQLCEKAAKVGRQMHVCFVDMEKAFDRIRREDVWNVLKRRGVKQQLIEGIKSLYENTVNYVRVRNEASRTFISKIGLRQGCILSPLLFNIVLDDVVKKCKGNMSKYRIGYWNMKMITITELCYADDLIIIGETEKQLQNNINVFNQELKKKNMKINIQKTKTMVIGNLEEKHSIEIDGKYLEQVKCYKYLGVVINSKGNLEEEINERVAKTGRLFNSIKASFLGKKEVPSSIKAEIVKKIMKPVLTYGSETWTTNERIRSKITSIEMRFLRKIEGKTKKDRIRNEVFRKNLDIVPVAITVEQAQLRWLGHIMRMGEDRLVKQVFEARETGKRKRGRPRRLWKEEVRLAAEERGVKWEKIKELVEDRKKWRDVWKKMTSE